LCVSIGDVSPYQSTTIGRARSCDCTVEDHGSGFIDAKDCAYACFLQWDRPVVLSRLNGKKSRCFVRFRSALGEAVSTTGGPKSNDHEICTDSMHVCIICFFLAQAIQDNFGECLCRRLGHLHRSSPQPKSAKILVRTLPSSFCFDSDPPIFYTQILKRLTPIFEA